MPSMHVAVALWVAFVVRAYLPRIQSIGWVYFVSILVGSVHLGWHYAWDSIVASLIAIGGWIVAPQLLKLSRSIANHKDRSPLPASM